LKRVVRDCIIWRVAVLVALYESPPAMPCQAGLDAPGTVHHVIPRGLERGQIAADGEDGESVLARLGPSLAEAARQPSISPPGIAKAHVERSRVH
jgi:hypothetical protein